MSSDIKNPLGNSLTEDQFAIVKQNAKTAIDNFVASTSTDMMTRQGRAGMDERKLRMAQAHVAGQEKGSDLLDREAEARGVTVDELAAVIIERAKRSDDIEVWRIQMKMAIETAETRGAILTLFGEQNIPSHFLQNNGI